MSRYATDADLLERIPDAASVDAALRANALSDAAVEIDRDLFGDLTLRAHVALAAHFLAVDHGVLGGTGTATVASRSAGEISVSYAVAAPADGEQGYDTTKWGREFTRILRKVPHWLITV